MFFVSCVSHASVSVHCLPSWHTGLWLKGYDLKIFHFLALVAMLFSQAEPSDQFW